MQQTVDRVKSVLDGAYLKYQLQRRNSDRPRVKVPIFVDTSRFIIKTADSFSELQQVLRLRYEVFLKEQLNKKLPLRFDMDEFDFICDHLLIIDKASSAVVGTYRVISSQVSSKFYSQAEFEMQGLLSMPGHKLELGRACIHKDYRSGAVMTLLWRGLSEYMKQSGTRFLFGCSSVKTTDPTMAALIMQYLASQNALRSDFNIKPTKEYTFSELEEIESLIKTSVTSFHESFSQQFLPPLLKGYLRAGAKICGAPALDRAFKCIDLMTILDLESVADNYRSRFDLPRGGAA